MSALTGPRVAARSGDAPTALVVFLHGFGADGNDLISLAEIFGEVLPFAEFVSPNAPLAMDMGGRAWFPLTMRDPSEYTRGVVSAAPALQTFLDGELTRTGLAESRLALIGFSQGTMMALHVAYRRAAPIAAVVGYSGLCAGADEAGLKPAPTLLVHGAADQVVPPPMTPAAAQLLGAAGIPVEWHMVPGLGHGIEQTGLAMAAEHLQRHLGRG
ncbi:MAG: alpha/beta fold hydrolase [Acuticoccus sp.]